jgi:serine/threonine-protein kinase
MSDEGELREGEVLLGKYRIGPRVGAGGMAVIHRATSLGAAGFERPVVIKAIRPGLASSPDMVRQFIQEASVGATLVHPSIVQVFDLGEHEGRLFMVLEYVAGKDLAALSFRVRRAQRVLSPELVAFITIDVCKALECAHEHVDDDGKRSPVVHRDISPQNILLSREGHVKLADFGMARALGVARQTAFGVIKGKLSYMSPEQSHGAEVDGRSDIFSLGTVVWETLTGKRLFLADSMPETIRRVREGQVPPLSHVAPHVSEGLSSIVSRALATRPEDRYQTATEMRQALQAYLRTARRVDAGVLAAVLGTYFPPDDDMTEAAEPSLSYSDEKDTYHDEDDDEDEDTDERATLADDFVPSLDSEPPNSPALAHTLIMFGDESRKIAEAIERAKALASAAGSAAGPAPVGAASGASASKRPLSPNVVVDADVVVDDSARKQPTTTTTATTSTFASGLCESGASSAAGPVPSAVAAPRKDKPRVTPLVIALILGIPTGIGVGLAVFWFLTR